MIQRKQRRTYLAHQSFSAGVAKSKLVDVASPVAAPDASPPAAILLAVATISPPRAEEPCRVAGDVVLEGQQCVPLVREAAHARSVTTSWWLGLLLGMRGEEEAAGDDEQHENRSWAMHDGQWQWQQQSTVLLC
jgi:hypothetical protein